MADELLHTKLHAPSLGPNLVQRPQLIEKLNNGLLGKLTLLSAPAGYGKTTLVNECTADCEWPVAWLSLDEDDSDPARFLSYVVASLRTIGADFGEELLAAYQTAQPPSLKTSITSLINELGAIPEDIILVLNDFHLIRADAIHDALAYLLEHQPAQLHLVITTREDPPVPLPRLRARRELTEIRESDLRFTHAETKSLLVDIMNFSLTTEQVETLNTKTEGWISGLQLAALSMRGQADIDRFVRSFAGSSRFILDYLIEEVFQQQPPEVQEFLLKTAILEQLSASLCDAVVADIETAEPNSQAMLDRLEQANLFLIPLDDSRQWFRYHHLFAELLRQRQRLAKGDTAGLHNRAALWHEQHGYSRRAIKHYLAASSWEKAAALIYKQSRELLKHGENVTFLSWMQALPDSAIQMQPHLCLEYAWALALSGRPDEADSYLQIAEEAFRSDPAQYSKVLSAQIHIARVRQDLPQTIALSQRALSLIPTAAYDPRCALALNLGMAFWQNGQVLEAESTFSEAQEMAQKAQNHHVRLLAVGFQSMAKAAQGRLHKAADLLRAALEWDADSPASALPHLVQGAIFYEWNRLGEAGAYLQKAITLAQISGNSELESSAYRQWALFKQAVDDDAGASAALALAERAAGKNAPSITRGRNLATAAYIALAQNDLETAKRRLDQMQTGASASIFYVPFFLTPARLYLAQGNKAAALEYLESESAGAGQTGWRYGQIEIRLLQALAAASANDALSFLTEALTAAQQEGFRRIFLDKGQSLIPLLHLAASKRVLPDFTKSLLAELEAALPPAPDPSLTNQIAPSSVEAISEREAEVLQLLAEGFTYQEIAQEMVISVNTVKGHLKNIYGKLSVHNRREAVARARVLHLIDPNT